MAGKKASDKDGIRITTLKNGFKVITDRSSSMNGAMVGIWTGVGSRYENAKNNGVAHHLEHMIFKGTKTRTSRQIVEEMEVIGAKTNAFTSKENTAYFAQGLPEHMGECAKVIADAMLNSTFPEDEMKSEKGAILQHPTALKDALAAGQKLVADNSPN